MRSSAQTWPSIPWTISWSRHTAGDAAIFPRGVRCSHTSLPERIDTARTTPRRLAMYATPSDTTAGNSISEPMPRLQTTRNGGRSRISGCACVRSGVAPYIVHCCAGR